MRKPTVPELAIGLIVMFLMVGASRAQTTTTTTKTTPVTTCSGANEERIECGPLCGDKTCTAMRAFNPASVRCSKACAPGCFCKSGYVRNSKGMCILPVGCLT
ncbi:venom peptide CtAPI-like [Anopheles aquasalis]|uniref:venom peptide CtAPI-like n=1 Tax=Anopheles aquasalis TaxID=42839 RepID=UPI00215ACAED|nr:venom peptide CtAPI-like [Anopheles aquasalis]